MNSVKTFRKKSIDRDVFQAALIANILNNGDCKYNLFKFNQVKPICSNLIKFSIFNFLYRF